MNYFTQLLNDIDPINPTEKMLDLLELLDFDKTYFEE